MDELINQRFRKWKEEHCCEDDTHIDMEQAAGLAMHMATMWIPAGPSQTKKTIMDLTPEERNKILDKWQGKVGP